MKLRNKKTGEIATLTLSSNGEELLLMKNNEMVTRNVKLSDLEEWEDYEEPKEYWAIDCFVPDGDLVSQFSNCSESVIENRKSIGNYFENEEEAKKAVEKLKAIEKLKEYELHIEWANTPEYDEDEDRWYCSVDFSVREGCNGDILFNLLFGGEV